MAVYVLLELGTTISWVRAPRSDQDLNVYVLPFNVCVSGALMVIREPTMAVMENGACRASAPPTTSVRPAGFVANVKTAVRGWRSRLTVAVGPSLSSAVRRSSSDAG